MEFKRNQQRIQPTDNPLQLDELEMLQLIASGLISYMEQVFAGEESPFPYPENLLRGFNQLALACVVRDVPTCDHPKSLPEFVQQWGQMPLLDWPLQLKVQ